MIYLVIAACSGAVRWEGPGPEATGRGARPSQVAPVSNPGTHTVRAGETLYAIATRYGLTPAELAVWNDLGDGSLIRVGQRLRLSAPAGGVALPRSSLPAAGDAPPGWQWPVAGPVLARFGESPATASGVQLGGRSGEAVRAAAGGQVVYAGSGLKAYGELLIIKHNPAWLSAYGYNEALLVREGERVAPGQVIARMGEGPAGSDGGRRPVLHFEIRRNGIPLDPLGQLPLRRE